MKFKLGLSLIAAAMTMAPAFATSAGVNGHALGTPVTCDDDEFISGGAYCNWYPANNTSINNGYAFRMGASGAPDTTVALRVNPTNFPMRSFQLDWNTTNSYEPWVAVLGNDRTDGIYGYWFYITSNENGLSSKALANNYTRYYYNALQDGNISSDRWNNIYFVDYLREFDGTQDLLRNIFVNNTVVIPDLHSGTNPPTSDCTMYWWD